MYLLLSSLCLIVTISWPAVFFTTTIRSSLSWNDFILYTQLHRLMIIVAWRRLVSLLSIGMECVECGRWLTAMSCLVCVECGRTVQSSMCVRVTQCNGTHGMRARWLTAMACLVCVECGCSRVQSSMRACWLMGMECHTLCKQRDVDWQLLCTSPSSLGARDGRVRVWVTGGVLGDVELLVQ